MKLIAGVTFLLISCILYADDNYPIPENINVTNYEFKIFLSDSYDLIKGEALITITHTGPTSDIWLDLTGIDEEGKGMVVEKVNLNNEIVEWVHSENRLRIKLTEEKEEGEISTISVKYYGTPKDGLIISSNKYGDRTFFADNWPDRARNWIPCVDHPSDKAFVDFIVYAPVHYEVVSNGYLYEESLLKEGIKMTHWKEEISIPTKVMVIGVARFAKQLAGRIGGTDIWTYVYPEDRENGFNDYAAAIKPFIFFSDEIGSYPYEKLANVQSKTMFGGMENAGCIFYSERSVTGKGTAERLMAHEIAHQWFGNSVTEKDWHHVWLSEGFATYFTALYQDHEKSNGKLRATMHLGRERVISAYEMNPKPIIDTTITNFMRLLSANSYQKGAWVLHMLRDELGEDVFKTGIQTYYYRFRNQNALSSDFKDTMEEISGKDLDKFFYQWLYRPGFPELKISWSYSPRKKETTILVEQVQTHTIFEFPLELEILVGDKSSVEKVRIEEASQTFILRTSGRPDAVNPDPNVKLLFN